MPCTEQQIEVVEQHFRALVFFSLVLAIESMKVGSFFSFSPMIS